LGRAVGWIAHSIEQYEVGGVIREPAMYTGPLPT
jgi:citrate synthase